MRSGQGKGNPCFVGRRPRRLATARSVSMCGKMRASQLKYGSDALPLSKLMPGGRWPCASWYPCKANASWRIWSAQRARAAEARTRCTAAVIMPARTVTMAITTSSSTNEKPSGRYRFETEQSSLERNRNETGIGSESWLLLAHMAVDDEVRVRVARDCRSLDIGVGTEFTKRRAGTHVVEVSRRLKVRSVDAFLLIALWERWTDLLNATT